MKTQKYQLEQSLQFLDKLANWFKTLMWIDYSFLNKNK